MLDRSFTLLAAAIALLSSLSLGFALVALALRYVNDVSRQKASKLNEAWEPVMLEVLEGTAEPDALSASVESRDESDFLAFLLGYARRLRGEEKEKVRALASPFLPHLESKARTRGAEGRGLAIQVLAEMGIPEHADTVAKALDDESPVVAMIAARGLLRPGQERYFGQVLQRLDRFALWSRSYIASMLAGGGPAAAPLLRVILTDTDQPPLVRAVAADALALLKDLSSVPIAIELLGEEEDRELVAGCIRLVRELGHREHVDEVARFVTDSDPVIRAAAVSAVGVIGGEDDVPVLQSLLGDESYWVSLHAARGLIQLGEEGVVQRLAAGGGPWALLARQVLSE